VRRVAESRRTRVDQLFDELRNELEWIPLKAIRKDRTERYRTAQELGDDVGNYLSHRPLVAAPESRWYRARKTIVRNRVAFAAAAVVVVAESLFRESLDLARRVLGADDQQTINLWFSTALLLERKGKLVEAEAILRRVVEQRKTARGPDHPSTLGALNRLGVVLKEQEKFEEAEALLRRALDAQRRVLGEEHEGTLSSMEALVWILHSQQRFSEAEPIAAELFKRTPRAQLSPTLRARYLAPYGVILVELRRYAEAEPPLRLAYEHLSRESPKSGPAKRVSGALAVVCDATGRTAEAAQIRDQSAATSQPRAAD
jgi:tetratricopeptide (TPR) repeat protein